MTPTTHIPPGDFGTQQQDGPFHRQYGSRTANREILQDAADQLGVSPWYLFKLLGLPNPDHGYHWLSGRKRPSPSYLIRLCKLLLMHLSGVDVLRIYSISWDVGQIVLKDEIDTRRVDSKARQKSSPALYALRGK